MLALLGHQLLRQLSPASFLLPAKLQSAVHYELALCQPLTTSQGMLFNTKHMEMPGRKEGRWHCWLPRDSLTA